MLYDAASKKHNHCMHIQIYDAKTHEEIEEVYKADPEEGWKEMKVRSMADSVEKELIAEENDLIREEVKNRIDRVRGVKNKLSNAADSLNYLLDMDIEEARKKLHNGQLQW